MIAVVDYGLGNVQAFINIYRRLEIPCVAATTPAQVDSATRLILPGVGAFDDAMRRLSASGLRESLERSVLQRQVPLLGVCVGMQMLARSSDEGTLPGLGWIAGSVRQFDVAAMHDATRLPHMGWNDVSPVRQDDPLFAGLEEGARFYFLHSYYFSPDEAASQAAWTDYHGRFSSAVRRGHIAGVQFHPEKSHRWGVRLLQYFAQG